MTLWRSCNVNNVRANGLQHRFQIGKAFRNAKAAPQLLRHEQFSIAKGNNFAIRNPVDGLHMLVGNLAATDYRDAKHSSRDQRSEIRSQIPPVYLFFLLSWLPD